MRSLSVLCLAVLLPGCATIMEGTGQTVSINTDPSGALCRVSRNGATLGEISSTPGSVRVDKSKNDISVSCSKDGYKTATISQSPSFNGSTFGNILLGGIVGAGVDAATGANYNYPGTLHIPLSADPALASKPAAPLVPQPAMYGLHASPES